MYICISLFTLNSLLSQLTPKDGDVSTYLLSQLKDAVWLDLNAFKDYICPGQLLSQPYYTSSFGMIIYFPQFLTLPPTVNTLDFSQLVWMVWFPFHISILEPMIDKIFHIFLYGSACMLVKTCKQFMFLMQFSEVFWAYLWSTC